MNINQENNYILEEEKTIKKPCKTCACYCGTDEAGDLCSINGACKQYTEWFLSKDGWRKIVEPFRKLREG